MSGIFGLVRFDGGVVAQPSVERMRRAMAQWGTDANRLWADDSAALGLCLVWDTPEAEHESLPMQTSDRRLAFTAEARIDNRDELFDALSIGLAERRDIADGELLRRSYEHWGTRCAERVLGDWSFAAWQPETRQLVLARDHHGNTSLYYARDGAQLAFASDRRALRELGRPRTLNEVYLAQILVSWPAYHGSETIDAEIHRLPPAHTLTATDSNMQTSRFWRLEDTPERAPASADEYAHELVETLRVAVCARTRSRRPIAVTLSGGLDSGAVTVLAARELHANGRDLVAVTSGALEGAHDAAWGSDLSGATATAAAARVDLTIGPPGKLTPLEGLDRLLDIHGEPGHAAANYYWLVPMLESVRGHVVLTGQTGNGSFSWAGEPEIGDVTRALAHASLAAAFAAAIGLAAYHRPLSSVIALRKRLRTGQWRRGWRGQSMINPAFAERIGLRHLMREAGHDPYFRRRPDGRRGAQLRAIRPGRDIVGALWSELGSETGCIARDPMRDVRLLSFAYSLPNSAWRGPMDRWLARLATKDLLPDQVRLARRRGAQASDLSQQLNGLTPKILARIDSYRTARDYVDLDALRAMVIRLDGASPEVWSWSAAAVLRTLSAAQFIAQR